ncbi:E3 SUMO-protein ligase ZBED1-like [Amphiura filiformis]|uniref:E3 SUMO-protein ligase ZBED1-like n=1 Tax=Amphiura filiformis TaxID=82378 RepID=UPI003B21D679
MPSLVWTYFKKNADGLSAQCQLCGNSIKNKGSNTSNLLGHLRNRHAPQHSLISSKKKPAYSAPDSSSSSSSSRPAGSQQATLAAAIERSRKLTPGEKRYEEITDAVSFYLAKDGQAFNSVQRPGFKHLMRVMDPRYQVPVKSTFSRRTAKLYDTTRTSVLEELSNIDFFASTTDMWSSHGMTPYIGYTVHWVDEAWRLRSRSLGTRYVPEDHTAANLSVCMTDLLDHWGLDVDKQVAMTTDNGANIVKACRDLDWKGATCFGHNLHLAITTTISKDDRLRRAVAICSKATAAFSMSFKRKRELEKVQLRQQEELDAQEATPRAPVKLAVACPTRWGSMARMIDRFLKARQSVTTVLQGNRDTAHLVPKWQDIDVLEALNKAITPLATFTDILSGDSYITISALKAVLHRLAKFELHPATTDEQLTIDIKQEILTKLQARFVGDEEKELLINTTSDEDLGGAHSTTETPQTPASAGASPRDRLQKELDMYTKFPNATAKEDPLDWWRVNCKNLPLLSQFAKKYLCIQASSSASERLFSKAGQVITPQRAQMKPEKADMCVFLRDNL